MSITVWLVVNLVHGVQRAQVVHDVHVVHPVQQGRGVRETTHRLVVVICVVSGATVFAHKSLYP
ncbi:hypothetical protein JAK72_10665 [Stenotrophomonas maltophilia]|uniref:hypothetical protein n=1 Tax=Stenotrophomonas maltophilia TaxID=40324 RepID=UPI0021C60736|nr:hypothetical protein [Stenotrophomonas maltophilia]MCU1038643.1 hypothetical protein [Stenotrophomonas maltophilia]